MPASAIKPVLAFLGRSGDKAGADRFELLAAIAGQGSISAAAKQVGLSYRAAWDAVNALNNLFPRPLVETRPGGKHGGSAFVTDEGMRILKAHRFLSGRLETVVAELQAAILADPEGSETSIPLLWSFGMKTSARNTYFGVVSSITTGAVNAEVEMTISSTTTLTALITVKSAVSLGLHPGREVFALIKASTPILVPATDDLRTSARNRLCGTVLSVDAGTVNAEIVLDLGEGKTLAATVTKESADALAFAPGDKVCALIKASQIILGVE
jgi:molybdate transport system regulatory protein